MNKNIGNSEYSDSRFNKEDIGTMNINDYIAILTNEIKNTDLKETEKIGRENNIKILAYLRDKKDAKNLSDAENILKEKKVDTKIVEFWIEDGMLSYYSDFFYVIRDGYPELKDKLGKILLQ